MQKVIEILFFPFVFFIIINFVLIIILVKSSLEIDNNRHKIRYLYLFIRSKIRITKDERDLLKIYFPEEEGVTKKLIKNHSKDRKGDKNE